MPDTSDGVTMAAVAPALTNEAAPLAGNGSRGASRKTGLGFWVPAVWIFLVFFGAVFAPWLGMDKPNASDPCNGLASIMLNTNATADQAQFISVGQAGTADQAQQMINGGTPIPTTPGCQHPSLDSRVEAYPSSRHWLGTDSIGRDNFSRLVWGGRVALTVGLVSIGIGMLIGGTIGLLAGFYRGKLESVLMTIVDVMLAYPALVLAIAIVAFAGQSLTNVTVGITIVAIPAFARIARAATLTYAEREFVTAARVMGAKNSRIIVREILPNAVLPVASFALVAVAIAIVAEGGLAFLGLSVPLPTASWGNMILDGYNKIERPLGAIIPSLMMFFTVLSFNLLGDKFRAIFDVKGTAL